MTIMEEENEKPLSILEARWKKLYKVQKNGVMYIVQSINMDVH